jgi:hypothetical protein
VSQNSPALQRREEESERHAAEKHAKAELENARHLYFELGPSDRRAMERANRLLAEKERDRAQARAEARALAEKMRDRTTSRMPLLDLESLHYHEKDPQAPSKCENIPQKQETASSSDVSEPSAEPASNAAAQQQSSSSLSPSLRASSDRTELHGTFQQGSATPSHTASINHKTLSYSEFLDNVSWMTPEFFAEMEPDLVRGSLDAPPDIQSVYSNDPNPDLKVPEAYQQPSAVATATANDTPIQRPVAIRVKLPLKPVVHDHGTVNTWLNIALAGKADVDTNWDYDGGSSGPSSYAASVASVFSVVSLASSASDISRGSGYSAAQVATATKVLLSIFYEDETLLSLYKSAVKSQNIGPERLQRNLRRLFRAYAGLLESEATERLEYLASRLVLMKSAFLAESIVEKLQARPVGAQSPRGERNEESSDEEDENDTSSRAVNEEAFEDLDTFHEFLVESEAFKTFRDRLQAFIVPKPTHLAQAESTSIGAAWSVEKFEPEVTKGDAGPNMVTWQIWRDDIRQSGDGLFQGTLVKTTASSLFHLMVDALMLVTDDLLIAVGQLEPPLMPNMVRLRWKCVRPTVLGATFTSTVSSNTNALAGLWRIPSQRCFRTPRGRYN